MANLPWDDPSCGIQKKVLHAGVGDIPAYVDSTKVTFHYLSRKCDDDKTVLDDSKKDGGKPLELYMGKKFKFEVWETCLRTMRLSEVASFTVDKSLAGAYPLVAKNLRDIRKGKGGESHHCCGLAMKEHGLGYPDLDELLKNNETLEFILEISKIEEPGDYTKEAWTMDEGEKLAAIPKLKEEGNELYKNKQNGAAADKYAQAIGMLEQLLLREKPGDEYWKKLDQMKVPLLLNYAQCKLLEGDFYQVIEHTTEVLQRDSDNVKALFRRAKAHVGAWNPKEAKDDFNKVSDLDPTLAKTCQKEIKEVERKEKEKDVEDKQKLHGKMFG